MFPSAELSDAAFLRAIWTVSLTLASASLTGLLALAILRSLRDWRRATERARLDELRAEIRDLLMADFSFDAVNLRQLSRREQGVLIAVLLGYFRNLDGARTDRLRDLVEAWDMEAVLRSAAMRGPRPDRLRSLAVLSRLDTPSSLETIRAVLSDRDGPVRLAALRALARRRTDIPAAILVDIARSTAAENVALLTSVLRQIGPDAQEAMEELVRNPPDTNTLGAALGGLGGIGLSSLSIELRPLAGHPDPEIRKRVASLAACFASVDTHACLAVLVTDPDAQVREVTATALGERKRTDEMDHLVALLRDPVWRVRWAASAALVLMGQAGRLLLKAAAQDNRDLEEIAEEALFRPVPA